MTVDPQAARDSLDRAQNHLQRVRDAVDPVDWPNLAVWGFYCLESLVLAAAATIGMSVKQNHPAKAEAAKQLSAGHGLSDVERLLVELNRARKSQAYGDIEMPELDPTELLATIEAYSMEVERLMMGRSTSQET